MNSSDKTPKFDIASATVVRLEPSLIPQVNRFYQAQGDKAKAKPHEQVFAVYVGSSIVAAVRLLHQASHDYAWIRSLCVATAWRAQGVGSYLMTQLHSCGALPPYYCFALTSAVTFYKRLGYQEWLLESEDLPQAIKAAALKAQQRNKPWVLMRFIAP